MARTVYGEYRIKIYSGVGVTTYNYNEIVVTNPRLTMDERIWLYYQVAVISARLTERIVNPIALVINSELSSKQIARLHKLIQLEFTTDKIKPGKFHFLNAA